MYNYDSDEFMTLLYEGVYIVDKSRKIVFWNKGSEMITSYKSSQVQNSYCYQNILNHVDNAGKKLCLEGCPLQNTLDTGKINENDVFLEHKKGYRVPVSVKTFPLYDDLGNITAAVEVFTDSRFKENQYKENLELKKLVQTDDLTQLNNRKYLNFKLRQSILESNEFNRGFGLLFLDIDHFKNVNDTYGHNIGDEILKIIANTIKVNVGTNDIVGRWGGEEFVAITKTENLSELKKLAEKLRQLCENSSYRYQDKSIKVTISIGGTLYKQNEHVDDFIHRADQLMYKAKHTGRNKSVIK